MIPFFDINADQLFVRNYEQVTTVTTRETHAHKVERLIHEYSGSHATQTIQLWGGESGLRWWAKNPTSGACGIPQAHPCSKMPCELTFADVECQIRWGYDYIKNRYGDGRQALAFWQSQLPHWY